MNQYTLDRKASIQRLRDADCALPLAEAIVDIVAVNRGELVSNSDFVSLSGSVEEIQTDVSVLKTDVSVLKKDVSELKDGAKEQKHEIQILRIDVKNLEEKIDLRFDTMRADFNVLKEEFKGIAGRFEGLSKEFEALRPRIIVWMLGGIIFSAALIHGIEALVRVFT